MTYADNIKHTLRELLKNLAKCNVHENVEIRGFSGIRHKVDFLIESNHSKTIIIVCSSGFLDMIKFLPLFLIKIDTETKVVLLCNKAKREIRKLAEKLGIEIIENYDLGKLKEILKVMK